MYVIDLPLFDYFVCCDTYLMLSDSYFGNFENKVNVELAKFSYWMQANIFSLNYSKRANIQNYIYCYSGYQVFLINSFYLALLVM